MNSKTKRADDITVTHPLAFSAERRISARRCVGVRLPDLGLSKMAHRYFTFAILGWQG